MYALRLAEDGRILEVMDISHRTDYTPVVDSFPNGEEINLADYKYINDEWVLEPLPKEKSDTERITELEEALAALLGGATE